LPDDCFLIAGQGGGNMPCRVREGVGWIRLA